MRKIRETCIKCNMIRITEDGIYGLRTSDRCYIGGFRGRKCKHNWVSGRV
ncbi:MAG: hypothetical protein Q7R52_02470 [archaeon]|nr:hypothetical protein [archaeon]